MSTFSGNPTRADAAIEAAAVAWLCERDEGFTPARDREFAQWRDADVRHAAAVARVERSLALLEEMPAVRTSLETRFARPPASFAPVPTRRRFRAALWISGLAAALILGGGLLWRTPLSQATIQHYSTEAGAPRRVELPDGSIVNLNAASEVHVRFSPGERRIALTAGEAHFDVASNPARPFIVTAGGIAVRAVGTAFNVRMAAAVVEVLVVEGRVELARETTAALATAVSAPASVSAPLPRLVAGERVSVARHKVPLAPQVEQAGPEQIRAALAWLDPMVSFSDVPLRDVVAQFNRRNSVQIVIAEAELGARKVGGSFALDQAESFVRLLEQDGDVVAARRGGHEIVLRRAR